MRPVRLLCDLHDLITDAGYLVGVLALALMPSIFVAEIVLRFLFGVMLTWSNDAFANLLAISIFAILPHVTRGGRHISIDLLTELRQDWKPAIRAMIGIAGLVICAALAWMSLNENLRQIARSMMTPQNHPIPVVWISGFLTYGFASSALYFLRSIRPIPALVPRSRVAPDLAEPGLQDV